MVILSELLGKKHQIRTRVYVVEHAVVGGHPTGQSRPELDGPLFEGVWGLAQ